MNIKKIVLFIFSLLIICPAIAQKRWSFIPQAGVQISNIKNNLDIHSSSRVGYRLGLLGDYQFTRGIIGNLSLQSGLFISSKGTNENSSNNIKSEYLEVPLLLNIGIHLTQTVDIHLKAGPYFGYSFSYTSVIHEPMGLPSSSDAPFICPYDYGIELGLGATYRRFIINIGSNLGLYDFYIDKVKEGDYYMKNRTLHITLGYQF